LPGSEFSQTELWGEKNDDQNTGDDTHKIYINKERRVSESEKKSSSLTVPQLVRAQEYQLILSLTSTWDHLIESGSHGFRFKKRAQKFSELVKLFFYRVYSGIAISYQDDCIKINDHLLEGRRDGDNFKHFIDTFFKKHSITEVRIKQSLISENFIVFLEMVKEQIFAINSSEEIYSNLSYTIGEITGVFPIHDRKRHSDLTTLSKMEMTNAGKYSKLNKESSLGGLQKALYSANSAQKRGALHRLLEIVHIKVRVVLNRYLKDLIHISKDSISDELIYFINAVVESGHDDYISILGPLLFSHIHSVRFHALYSLPKLENSSPIVGNIVNKIESHGFQHMKIDELTLFLNLIRPDNFDKTLPPLAKVHLLEGGTLSKSVYKEFKETVYLFLVSYSHYKNIVDWFKAGVINGNKESIELISIHASHIVFSSD